MRGIINMKEKMVGNTINAVRGIYEDTDKTLLTGMTLIGLGLGTGLPMIVSSILRTKKK